MSSKEISIPGKGGQLAAKIWGSPQGIKVLALHGWLDNAASFDKLAPHFPELQLVCLDLRGHGLSDHHPPGVGYQITDGIADVTQAADHLGWDRFSILGHSMGGSVGVLASAALEDRIERLILVESLGPLSEAASEAANRLKAFARDRGLLDQKQVPRYPTLELAAKARRTAGELTAEGALALVTRGARPVEGGFTWRSDPRLKMSSPYRMTEEQVLVILGAVTCPTLLIQADRGILPEGIVATRQAQMPQVKKEKVVGGHHVHLDDPSQVVPSSRNFFSLD